jgi:hypothetical protein
MDRSSWSRSWGRCPTWQQWKPRRVRTRRSDHNELDELHTGLVAELPSGAMAPLVMLEMRLVTRFTSGLATMRSISPTR